MDFCIDMDTLYNSSPSLPQTTVKYQSMYMNSLPPVSDTKSVCIALFKNSLPAVPDVARTDCQDYEELPDRKLDGNKYEYIEVQEAIPSSRSSALCANTSEITLVSQPSTHNKRHNPIYQTSDLDNVKLNTSVGLSVCPYLGLLLVGVLAIVTLVLTILTAVGVFDPYRISSHSVDVPQVASLANSTQLQAQRLRQLEEHYNKLLHMLQDSDASVRSSLLKLTTDMHQKETVLSHTIVQEILNLHMRLDTFNTDIHSQMNSISKLPGPPGPPGDFTRCRHHMTQRGSAITAPSSSTPWLSDNDKEWVILGVECTTDKGLTSSLQTRTEQDVVQYSCKCTGSLNAATSGIRKCQLHIWQCPLTVN